MESFIGALISESPHRFFATRNAARREIVDCIENF
jgi:hypothetical protein